MSKACIESKFLTSLQTNTIYVANYADKNYDCPQTLCSEVGSFTSPCSSIEQACSIIEKKFSDKTKVTISFLPGSYTISTSCLIPKNVISMVSSLGNTLIEGNLSIINHPLLKIKNIDITGDIELSSNGENSNEFYIENCNLGGRYTINVKDKATQSLLFETVEQIIETTSPGQEYGNEIIVSNNGNAVVKKLDCILESKLKEKINLSDNGTLDREIKNYILKTAGEDSTYSNTSSFTYRATNIEIYSSF
jgi:hypothetical protein